jgi:hypothetical protein
MAMEYPEQTSVCHDEPEYFVQIQTRPQVHRHHYLINPSRGMITSDDQKNIEILSFHSGDCEECYLLYCGAV